MRLYLLSVVLFCANINAQNIYTFAGSGFDTPQFSGDGGPASLAKINVPYRVYVDLSNNVYFIDFYNSRIRMVNSAGIVNTIIGKGFDGYNGDGGKADTTLFYGMSGVGMDALGNTYISDPGNHRIRKVDNLGFVSTIAGTGILGYSGDGGPATSAKIDSPQDIKVDGIGNVYFADKPNNRIRKIDVSGIITTVAGNGTQGFGGDGGSALTASLFYPTAVDADGYGNIYIADQYNHRIRKVDASGIITTIAGNGVGGYNGDAISAVSANINTPSDVKVGSDGSIYIADYKNHRIRKINTSGIITTITGDGTPAFSGDNGLASLAQVKYPTDIAVDSFGNIYFADSNNARVRVICTNDCFAGFDDLINQDGMINIYPNPTTNILNIHSENNEFKNSEIEIANYLGQTILKLSYSNKISLSELPAGYYSLKISSPSGQFHSNFIKE